MNRLFRAVILTSPFVAAVALLVPYVWPPERAPTSWFFDVHHQHAPMVSLLASGLWGDHEVPLWNLQDFAGMPTVGDPQAGIYNPVYWVLTLCPTVHAFGLLIVAYALVGALGFILYARTLGLSVPAAAVGAVVFVFGGKLLMHVVLLGHTVYAPFFLVPFLLWALHWTVEGPKPERVAGVALLIGLLVVSLHPQLLFYTVGLLLAISVAKVLSAPQRARALGTLALCATVGLTLAVVHLLPIAALASEFSRYQPGLFDPTDWASDWPGGGWFVRLVSGFGVTPQSVLSDWHYYLGGPGLLLLALGLLSWPRGDPRRRVVGLHGTLAIILLLYGLGTAGGIEPLLAELPVFERFRLPTRALIVLGLPIALLAALGVDALTGAPRLRRQLIGIAATLGGLFLLVTGNASPLRIGMFALVVGAAAFLHLAEGGVPLGLPVPSERAVTMNTETAEASARLRLATLTGGLILVIGLAVDNGSVVAPYIQTEPEEDLWRSANGVVLPDDLADAIRIAELGRGVGNAGLPQLLVRQQELETLAGFNALIPWRFVIYASAAGGFDPFESSFDVQVPLPERNMPKLFDLLGVTHFLRRSGSDPRSWYWERSDSAFPRAYLVPGPIIVPEDQGDEPLVAEIKGLVRLAQIDPRQQVLLHGTTAASALKEAGVTPGGPLEPYRVVPIRARTPNRIEINLRVERPAILVLNEAFFPGWLARDGEESLPVLRANGLFRGVALASGDHRIVFEFAPASWLIGWWISAAAAVVTVVLALLGLWQRVRARSWSGTVPSACFPFRFVST